MYTPRSALKKARPKKARYTKMYCSEIQHMLASLRYAIPRPLPQFTEPDHCLNELGETLGELADLALLGLG